MTRLFLLLLTLLTDMDICPAAKIILRISDPWELGQALKWVAFEAEIVSLSGDDVILRLLKPFVYRNTNCEYFVASPRHEGDHVDLLREGRSLFCGLTCITPEQASSKNPFDLSSWRGGVVIIGNLNLTL